MKQIKNMVGIVAVTIFSLLGCKGKNGEERYTFSGTIVNAANQKLLLQEIPFGEKPIITLDSITLDEKGKYSFEFIAKQEGLYRIATEKEVEILLVNDFLINQDSCKSIPSSSILFGALIHSIATSTKLPNSLSSIFFEGIALICSAATSEEYLEMPVKNIIQQD